jgi:hypothetical protein
MIRFVNKDILYRETGYLYDRMSFDWVQRLIEKTGETSFYLEPKDYFYIARYGYKETVTYGRTETGEPYAVVFGIKFIMVSGQRLQNIRVLL